MDEKSRIKMKSALKYQNELYITNKMTFEKYEKYLKCIAMDTYLLIRMLFQ